ncbi:hypothetical protein BJ546DRAFT_529833 [Cryomyces antarcticus]
MRSNSGRGSMPRPLACLSGLRAPRYVVVLFTNACQAGHGGAASYSYSISYARHVAQHLRSTFTLQEEFANQRCAYHALPQASRPDAAVAGTFHMRLKNHGTFTRSIRTVRRRHSSWKLKTCPCCGATGGWQSPISSEVACTRRSLESFESRCSLKFLGCSIPTASVEPNPAVRETRETTRLHPSLHHHLRSFDLVAYGIETRDGRGADCFP